MLLNLYLNELIPHLLPQTNPILPTGLSRIGLRRRIHAHATCIRRRFLHHLQMATQRVLQCREFAQLCFKLKFVVGCSWRIFCFWHFAAAGRRRVVSVRTRAHTQTYNLSPLTSITYGRTLCHTHALSLPHTQQDSQ